jgi:hypothetical protein
MKTFARFAVPAALSLLALFPRSARAQEAQPAAPPQVVVVQPAAPAQPATAPASSTQQPNGEYQAPLQQRTQPSYLPQSVAMSGPPQMDWDDDRQAPPGYHLETRVRKGLVIAGSVTFGSMYLLTAMGAAIANDSCKSCNGSLLYVPVAGPLLYLGEVPSQTGKLFLVVDSVAQAAGAAMLIAGIASPKTIAVRNDLAKIEITPVFGPGSAGIVGTF